MKQRYTATFKREIVQKYEALSPKPSKTGITRMNVHTTLVNSTFTEQHNKRGFTSIWALILKNSARFTTMNWDSNAQMGRGILCLVILYIFKDIYIIVQVINPSLRYAAKNSDLKSQKHCLFIQN